MHRHLDLRCQKYRQGAGRFDPRRDGSELESNKSYARAANMVSSITRARPTLGCRRSGRENRVADEFHWWQAVLAGLGGGSIVKALDIVYLEIRRLREGSRTATRFVDEHLDPLLKASDELVGKLLALGKEDFRSLRVLDSASTLADSNELGGLVFLFARFWAQIEIIKREGLSVAISQDERGRHLENFLDCLESTRVRLVDRTAQRALGETVLEAQSGKLQTVAYIEFIRRSPEPEIAR
jgi:hypothetical protein